MKVYTKLCVILGAPFAAAGIAAAPAQAVIVDEYASVRLWMCSENGATVNTSYTNSYGNTISKDEVYFVNGNVSQNGKTHCISRDYQAGEYGMSVHASVVDEDGGWVHCAIFEDGVKIAESEDNSDYYSAAGCY